MNSFAEKLADAFGERIWFVGLQGSYGRGEATEASDIDPVVILDTLTPADLQTYHAMLDTLPHRNRVCGFVSGREEILHWDAADLFQFCHDTTPIRGSLEQVLAVVDDAAVNRAVKLGACNLFHGCVHNMLHEQSEDVLCALYKSACFVVQAIVFQQSGTYVRQQSRLLYAVSPRDRVIVDTFLHLKQGGAVDFSSHSETLFCWAQRLIVEGP